MLVGLRARGPDSPSDPTPPVPQALDLTQAIGPAVSHGNGLAEGVIGATRIEVDPTTLTAKVIEPRGLQTQGDLYYLSIRPFLGPGDVSVTKVQRSAGQNVILTVRFRHPFDAPADLNPPATAAKRIDLHIFDVTALVVAEGNETFFAGPGQVRTNTTILPNADAYRDPGPTFDKTAFGVANATIFPYKLVAQNIDTANPQGNYNPTANGWTGNNLLAPTGYDVFPQGAEVEVDFELRITPTPMSFDLVTLAKYMDPRATPQPKLKRLPIAGDPTSLQYILPEAAGDVQRITATPQGTLQGFNTTQLMTVDVEVLDWDHGATIAGTFPNNANLNEISEPSDVTAVDLSVPTIRASGEFSAGSIGGTAPLVTASIPVLNTDGYNPGPAAADVTGLVRVTDEQDADDATDTTKPLVLGEEAPAPIPGATLSSARYQTVAITVTPGGDPPSCLAYSPNSPALRVIQNTPFNLDLDAASIPASHPDGIAEYQIDYDNDGTYDGTGFPGGTPAGDFNTNYLYGNAGPRTIQVAVTANPPTNLTTVCPLTVSVVPPPPTCPTFPAPALFTMAGQPYNLDLDGASALATHPDGISQYRIDYNNDGTFDATSTGPGGTSAGDFSASHTYPTGGTQIVQIEVTSAGSVQATAVCPFTVCIGNIGLEPIPTPNAINPTQGTLSASMASESNRQVALDLPGGGMLWFHRVSTTGGVEPAGLYWYYSADSGVTWSKIGGPITSFAGTAITTTSSGSTYDMQLLANGVPAMVISDGSSDLAFVSAVSLTPTAIDWGPLTGTTSARGVEIAGATGSLNASGTYSDANLVPHPTNPNIAWIVAQNTTTTGLHPDALGIYQTLNATAANPTFTFLTVVETPIASTSEEDTPNALVDASGVIHLVYESSTSSTVGDHIAYRTYDTNTMTLSPEQDISTTAGMPAADNVEAPYMALGPGGTVVVVWDHDFSATTTATSYPAMTVKSGAVWSTPFILSDPCQNVQSNAIDGLVVAHDSA
ncbi:MAG TPA: hypothetical protein VEI97_07290, partial [bacterium]|nr:hypothetical protein [bacterium]